MILLCVSGKVFPCQIYIDSIILVPVSYLKHLDYMYLSSVPSCPSRRRRRPLPVRPVVVVRRLSRSVRPVVAVSVLCPSVRPSHRPSSARPSRRRPSSLHPSRRPSRQRREAYVGRG